MKKIIALVIAAAFVFAAAPQLFAAQVLPSEFKKTPFYGINKKIGDLAKKLDKEKNQAKRDKIQKQIDDIQKKFDEAIEKAEESVNKEKDKLDKKLEAATADKDKAAIEKKIKALDVELEKLQAFKLGSDYTPSIESPNVTKEKEKSADKE